MVSLQRRQVRRQKYWYLVQSGRVKGKPRIVWQKYLGTPDRIKELLEQAQKGGGPLEVDVTNFGPAAALRLAQELGLVEIIDRLVPKRDQGYSGRGAPPHRRAEPVPRPLRQAPDPS
ncbi:hypothetical protein B1B_05755, partial [mine drainage metagenome]